MTTDDPIVRRGVWLYAGYVPAAIRITRSDMFYGSGDYQEPPENGDDRQEETFSIWYESPPGSGRFPSGGGQFPSLADAIAHVEQLLTTKVTWQ